MNIKQQADRDTEAPIWPVEQQVNIDLYRRFLSALNRDDYAQIDTIIDASFLDHHVGFDINSLETYKEALRMVSNALSLKGELEDILASEDKVVTRVKLIGRHTGTFMGFLPTGKEVAWETTEIWRVANGKLVERWAQDDVYSLVKQLSADDENVRLIRHLNDVVNSRQYEGMDELFSASFEDRNPAWSVKDINELKQIIAAAHKALDMHSNHDQIYPAEGNKVVIHITFSGRHIGTFLGMPPTGKPVAWTSIEIYRIEDHKIVERWVQADTTGLMRQLGVQFPS
jgi:predicted ester cyclase